VGEQLPVNHAQSRTRLRRRATRIRRLVLLFVLLVSLASIVGYVVLSITLNGLPPYRTFPGWVAILQPLSQRAGDEVQLQVQSAALGNHPLVGYSVVVCGAHPYDADLLIGGAARLTEARPYPAQLSALPSPPRIQQLPRLVLGYDVPIDLGTVQLVHVTLPTVSPCPPISGTGVISGSTEGIAGLMAAPLQQSWTGFWNWWRGPHSSLAWPLTGNLPDVPPGVLGVFTGLSGLHGQWTRPVTQYVQVSRLAPPLTQSVDFAAPSPTDTAAPSWSSLTPIGPIARLTDTTSAAQLQEWIIFCAVGLGIGGSMLGAVALDWLRFRRADASEEQSDDPPASPPGHAARPAFSLSAHQLAIIAGVAIVSAYLRRRASHRDS
jgi:hypothetical protein